MSRNGWRQGCLVACVQLPPPSEKFEEGAIFLGEEGATVHYYRSPVKIAYRRVQLLMRKDYHRKIMVFLQVQRFQVAKGTSIEMRKKLNSVICLPKLKRKDFHLTLILLSVHETLCLIDSLFHFLSFIFFLLLNLHVSFHASIPWNIQAVRVKLRAVNFFTPAVVKTPCNVFTINFL